MDAENRALWQAQLDIAIARERTWGQQISLLTAQRDIINEQLDDAKRKYEEAQRQARNAEEMLTTIDEST